MIHSTEKRVLPRAIVCPKLGQVTVFHHLEQNEYYLFHRVVATDLGSLTTVWVPECLGCWLVPVIDLRSDFYPL